ALLPRPPCNRDLVLRQFRDHLLAGAGDRPVGVFMNRRARNVEIRYLLIQEANQRPHQPALGLSLLAEKEHVVPGDQGQIDLRNHRAVVADDSGKQLVAAGKHGEEIVPDLVFDRFGNPAAIAKLLEVGRTRLVGHYPVDSSEGCSDSFLHCRGRPTGPASFDHGRSRFCSCTPVRLDLRCAEPWCACRSIWTITPRRAPIRAWWRRCCRISRRNTATLPAAITSLDSKRRRQSNMRGSRLQRCSMPARVKSSSRAARRRATILPSRVWRR